MNLPIIMETPIDKKRGDPENLKAVMNLHQTIVIVEIKKPVKYIQWLPIYVLNSINIIWCSAAMTTKIEMVLPWMKQSVGLSLIKVVRIKPFSEY